MKLIDMRVYHDLIISLTLICVCSCKPQPTSVTITDKLTENVASGLGLKSGDITKLDVIEPFLLDYFGLGSNRDTIMEKMETLRRDLPNSLDVDYDQAADAVSITYKDENGDRMMLNIGLKRDTNGGLVKVNVAIMGILGYGNQ